MLKLEQAVLVEGKIRRRAADKPRRCDDFDDRRLPSLPG